MIPEEILKIVPQSLRFVEVLDIENRDTNLFTRLTKNSFYRTEYIDCYPNYRRTSKMIKISNEPI